MKRCAESRHARSRLHLFVPNPDINGVDQFLVRGENTFDAVEVEEETVDRRFVHDASFDVTGRHGAGAVSTEPASVTS